MPHGRFQEAAMQQRMLEPVAEAFHADGILEMEGFFRMRPDDFISHYSGRAEYQSICDGGISYVQYSENGRPLQDTQ